MRTTFALWLTLVAALLEPISGSRLYPEAQFETWNLDNLIARIGGGGRVEPRSTLLWMTMTRGQQHERLAGDKTILDFIKLNQFDLDQCKHERLQQRAQFCHDLMPYEARSLFDAKENLRLFCRTTLFLVARNCVELGGRHATNKAELSSIAPIGQILQSTPTKNLVEHLSSMAEARYRPTALEGYLLEESGEN